MEKERTDEHSEKEEELQEEEAKAREEPEIDEETEEIAKEPEILKEEAGEEAAEGEPLEEEKGEKEAQTRREEKEKEFVEERVYTIPLRRAWIMPPNKRAPRAIRMINAFIQRHMKVGEEAVEEEGEEKEGGRIIISNEVNEEIWSRGIEKPPRKLRIRAAKDEEGNVTIFLA
ncbi:MAG: 50S ribosomal protein L31e [Candidatus Bathyarchaeota archaeon]|nr:50S ribosomal protein L31e [Candidatus Bathyarchaeota archaeon]